MGPAWAGSGAPAQLAGFRGATRRQCAPFGGSASAACRAKLGGDGGASGAQHVASQRAAQQSTSQVAGRGR